MSGKAIAIKSLKEKWLSIVQSANEKGEKGIGGSSTVTLLDWSFNNGHLYFRNRMFVPPSARSALLHSIHSLPFLGHMGVFHTKAILERDFWWPGLSIFIKHFVASCPVCQQNKANTHPVVPPLLPIKSDISLPFKQLSIDLIMDLPPSAGFDSVMVVVDHGLMKGVILASCLKTINMAGVAQLFFDFIFKYFGLHDTIVTIYLFPCLHHLVNPSPQPPRNPATL